MLCYNDFFTATKNGLDGTDVRLLKQLVEKFKFAYNIIEPANYIDAIRLVCNSNFCEIAHTLPHIIFSPQIVMQT